MELATAIKQEKIMVKKLVSKRCQNTLTNGEECHRQIRYALHKVITDPKNEEVEISRQWLRVCATCEKAIGRERLVFQGWLIEDVLIWERDGDFQTPNYVPYSPGYRREKPNENKTIHRFPKLQILSD